MTVADGRFRTLKISAMHLDFGLEEVRAGLNALIEGHMERFPCEEFITAGHVGAPGAQQEVGKKGSSSGNNVALQGCGLELSSVGEAGTKDAIVAAGHSFEEARGVRR